MTILNAKTSLLVLTKTARARGGLSYHRIWQQGITAQPFHDSAKARVPNSQSSLVGDEKQGKENFMQPQSEETKLSDLQPPDSSPSPSVPTSYLPELLPHISPSPFHSSLQSFLDYASRVGLSPNATTYIGTRYEYICQSALQRFGFSLVRTGGAGDVGLDLLGTWTLPGFAQPLRALVQCKFRRAKPAPVLVRELEGAFLGGPVGWRVEDEKHAGGGDEGGLGLVGVLCVPGEPTKSVREAVKRSGRPVVVCVVGENGEVRQFFWNNRVERLGLEGWNIGVRYREREKEAVLLWRGEVWEIESEQERYNELGEQCR